MMQTNEAIEEVAAALYGGLTSDRASDESRGGSIVDALDRVADAGFAIARAIQRLGNADAATPLGGLEAHGKAILEAADLIASATRER